MSTVATVVRRPRIGSDAVQGLPTALAAIVGSWQQTNVDLLAGRNVYMEIAEALALPQPSAVSR